MKAGRIVALVLGCLVGVVGLALLIVGVAATVAYGAGRDDGEQTDGTEGQPSQHRLRVEPRARYHSPRSPSASLQRSGR